LVGLASISHFLIVAVFSRWRIFCTSHSM
jgi:hypothetical protein